MATIPQGSPDPRPIVRLWMDSRMPQPEAVEAMLEAACLALVKHKSVTTNPERMMAILAEELGEVSREVLDLTRPNPSGGTDPIQCVIRLRGELCQLAAYALLQVQNIDNGGFKQHVQSFQERRAKSTARR